VVEEAPGKGGGLREWAKRGKISTMGLIARVESGNT
tara:strand:- start:2184 stop:2291 length:108 start_codon:yes stop_codon:yes gene_type:complete